MFKKNFNASDIIVDALSTALTAAVKHFVIDRGIDYARNKVDEILAPPAIDAEPLDEEGQDKVEEDVKDIPEKKGVKKNQAK